MAVIAVLCVSWLAVSLPLGVLLGRAIRRAVGGEGDPRPAIAGGPATVTPLRAPVGPADS